MTEKKLGSEPLYPSKVLLYEGRTQESYQIGTDLFQHSGISQRLYVATMAMQGLLSNHVFMSQMASDYGEKLDEALAKNVYEITDELLKQENLCPPISSNNKVISTAKPS